MDLRYPDVRRVMVESLRDLADEHRHEEWARNDWMFFDLVNDLEQAVGGPARSGIGVVFYSEAEADAADAVVKVLDAVLAELGSTPAYSDVRSHPRWPEVVNAASSALAVITRQ